MEFWGIEVKVGEVVKVDPVDFDARIHISQAALGDAKKDKENDPPVVLYLKVDDQKLVVGTLFRDEIPQTHLDLIMEKEFEFSHNSTNDSVYFCGYKAIKYYNGEDASEEDDYEE